MSIIANLTPEDKFKSTLAQLDSDMTILSKSAQNINKLSVQKEIGPELERAQEKITELISNPDISIFKSPETFSNLLELRKRLSDGVFDVERFSKAQNDEVLAQIQQDLTSIQNCWESCVNAPALAVLLADKQIESDRLESMVQKMINYGDAERALALAERIPDQKRKNNSLLSVQQAFFHQALKDKKFDLAERLATTIPAELAAEIKIKNERFTDILDGMSEGIAIIKEVTPETVAALTRIIEKITDQKMRENYALKIFNLIEKRVSSAEQLLSLIPLLAPKEQVDKLKLTVNHPISDDGIHKIILMINPLKANDNESTNEILDTLLERAMKESKFATGFSISQAMSDEFRIQNALPRLIKNIKDSEHVLFGFLQHVIKQLPLGDVLSEYEDLINHPKMNAIAFANIAGHISQLSMLEGQKAVPTRINKNGYDVLLTEAIKEMVEPFFNKALQVEDFSSAFAMGNWTNETMATLTKLSEHLTKLLSQPKLVPELREKIEKEAVELQRIGFTVIDKLIEFDLSRNDFEGALRMAMKLADKPEKNILINDILNRFIDSKEKELKEVALKESSEKYNEELWASCKPLFLQLQQPKLQTAADRLFSIALKAHDYDSANLVNVCNEDTQKFKNNVSALFKAMAQLKPEEQIEKLITFVVVLESLERGKQDNELLAILEKHFARKDKNFEIIELAIRFLSVEKQQPYWEKFAVENEKGFDELVKDMPVNPGFDQAGFNHYLNKGDFPRALFFRKKFDKDAQEKALQLVNDKLIEFATLKNLSFEEAEKLLSEGNLDRGGVVALQTGESRWLSDQLRAHFSNKLLRENSALDAFQLASKITDDQRRVAQMLSLANRINDPGAFQGLIPQLPNLTRVTLLPVFLKFGIDGKDQPPFSTLELALKDISREYFPVGLMVLAMQPNLPLNMFHEIMKKGENIIDKERAEIYSALFTNALNRREFEMAELIPDLDVSDSEKWKNTPLAENVRARMYMDIVRVRGAPPTKEEVDLKASVAEKPLTKEEGFKLFNKFSRLDVDDASKSAFLILLSKANIDVSKETNELAAHKDEDKRIGMWIAILANALVTKTLDKDLATLSQKDLEEIVRTAEFSEEQYEDLFHYVLGKKDYSMAEQIAKKMKQKDLFLQAIAYQLLEELPVASAAAAASTSTAASIATKEMDSKEGIKNQEDSLDAILELIWKMDTEGMQLLTLKKVLDANTPFTSAQIEKFQEIINYSQKNPLLNAKRAEIVNAFNSKIVAASPDNYEKVLEGVARLRETIPAVLEPLYKEKNFISAIIEDKNFGWVMHILDKLLVQSKEEPLQKFGKEFKLKLFESAFNNNSPFFVNYLEMYLNLGNNVEALNVIKEIASSPDRVKNAFDNDKFRNSDHRDWIQEKVLELNPKAEAVFKGTAK